MKDNVTKMNFSVVPNYSRIIPQFDEVCRGTSEWLWFGNDNCYPQYLWKLYLKSSVLQSVIGGTTNFVIGNGLVEDKIINNNSDTLEDLIKRITTDYLIFGGFAIQVIRNRGGEIGELHWIDFLKLRCNEDGDKVFFSKNWKRSSNGAIDEYEVFDKNKKQANSILYFNGHISRGVYPIPLYNGALNAVETSTEISKYHLNSILNNFAGSAVINFNNGVPTEDVQKDIERKVNEKFGGADNAGRTLVSFNDNKDSAVTIERLTDDNQDKKYQSLRKDTYNEIFINFHCQPLLFGYVIEGNLFNKEEYDQAYGLYEKSMITPIKNDLERIFNELGITLAWKESNNINKIEGE